PGLGDGWEGEAGQPLDDKKWQVVNGEARTDGGIALVVSPPRENYLFETSLRLQRSSDRSSSGGGVIAAEMEGKERVTLAIEADQITLRSRSGGSKSTALPAG